MKALTAVPYFRDKISMDNTYQYFRKEQKVSILSKKYLTTLLGVSICMQKSLSWRREKYNFRKQRWGEIMGF